MNIYTVATDLASRGKERVSFLTGRGCSRRRFGHRLLLSRVACYATLNGLLGWGRTEVNQHLESISAIFPAYNDGPTIGGLVDRVHGLLVSLGREFEIIVVDDGSADSTAAVLQECKQRYGDAFRIIRHSVNRGYGAALRSGFEAATKDLIFYTDGDAQYDPLELPRLLDRLTPQIGLVN